MNTFHVGQMTKTRIHALRGDGDRYAYGIILQLRNKTGIALIDYLPLENMDRAWVAFDALTPVEV